MAEESLEAAHSESPQHQTTVNPFETVTPSSPNADTPRSTSDRLGDVLEAHETLAPPPITHRTPDVTHPEAQNAAEETLPPEVASLKAMFPDFDPVIIHSVLESVNGSQERATDVLLGMSDPEYVSQEHEQQPQLTQTELDEQLARRLMLEDQQQAQQEQRQYQRQPDTRVPYQPRVQGRTQAWSNQGGQNQGGQGQGRDTMSEVSDQFSKIAETGKKTFSSFITKVKAKIQELDQSRQSGNGGSGGSSSRTNNQYNQYQPNHSSGQYEEYSQQQYHPDYARSSQAQGTVDYFAAEPQLPARPTQGYDVTPPLSNRGSPPVLIPSNNLASPAINPAASNAYSPPAGTPPASTPVGIDRTKLGMLPKRPVSLVADTPAPESHRHADDDELDYVENPFEEEHR